MTETIPTKKRSACRPAWCIPSTRRSSYGQATSTYRRTARLGRAREFYSDGIVDIERYGANSRLISHCVRRWTGGLVALSSSA